MKIEKGNRYIDTKFDFAFEIREISGPSVYVDILEDYKYDDVWGSRVGKLKVYGIHVFNPERFKNFKGYNTPLYKILNRED